MSASKFQVLWLWEHRPQDNATKWALDGANENSERARNSRALHLPSVKYKYGASDNQKVMKNEKQFESPNAQVNVYELVNPKVRDTEPLSSKSPSVQSTDEHRAQ
jgi:hypothetical protein